MNHLLNVSLSVVASTLRTWRGTTASKASSQPPEAPILFDREGDPHCRLVREAITELNLDVIIAPCPLNGRNLKALKRESGNDTVPYLVDPNTQQKLRGPEEIISYIYRNYRGKDLDPKTGLFDKLSSYAASYARLNKGLFARPSKPCVEPLTLYSFESSPYSRPVRELLCELELPYLLVNLGKQQLSDMGPAKLRFNIGAYKPLPNTKREAFFKRFGNVQVPFLSDPNTGKELFESKEILRYLEETYALR